MAADHRQLVPWTIRLPLELDARVRRYIEDRHRDDPAVRVSVTGLIVELVDRHLHRRGYRRGQDFGEDVVPPTAAEELADDPDALLDAIEEYVLAGGSRIARMKAVCYLHPRCGLHAKWT